jgi:hypothetical protein
MVLTSEAASRVRMRSVHVLPGARAAGHSHAADADDRQAQP